MKQRGFGQTSRRDAWWVTPAITFAVLTGFIVYSTWAALQNAHYRTGPYLSPFYSPEIFGSSEAFFGPKPGSWPAWLPFSPALIILPFPALFRFTCYYYRGAYYKAFWADPPACAVSEPRKGYTSENGFPLKMQNVHRYFMYAAVLLLIFLWHDVWHALWFDGKFGLGIGTFVLLFNSVMLTLYTFSCHSLRHAIGGGKKCLSGHPIQSRCYGCVSNLNGRHMLFAWISLFGVMFADLYVRLVSMGVWSDVRIF
ncbi:MAG TPA: hypothetical protein VKT78_15500 [Fimbriimonadaceae bacterium]|nr:hypothetical protein [Fimbriimonadaceae bacterium]